MRRTVQELSGREKPASVLRVSRPIEVDSRIVSPYMKLRDGRLRSRNPCCMRSEADPVTVNSD
jgi:hypothetical protein